MRKDNADGIAFGVRFGSAAKISLLSLLCFAMLACLPSAQTPITWTNVGFCTSALSPQNSVLEVGPNNFNTLILVSALLLFLMVTIASFVYLIGYAFRVDKLMRFGKAELGEVAITAIIVIIFLGSFAALSSFPTVSVSGAVYSTVPGNFLAIAPSTLSPNLYLSDCNALSQASLTALGDLPPLLVSQKWVELYTSISFGQYIAYAGASEKPFAGLNIVNIALSDITNLGFVIAFLPIAVALIIGLFFAVFPLFLYLGIIFRTIPWTRAAGGAFLGLFIAFYILFPLLIYLLISQVNVTQIYLNSGGLSSFSLSWLENPISLFTPSSSAYGPGLISVFIQTVMAQLVYIVFAVVFALLISFDFMETMGDLLGAPSLRSSDTLRKII